MMKKSINIIIISALLLTFIIPLQVKAAPKTLKDYKNELAELQKQQRENNRLTANTKAQIDAKRNAITEANNTIATNEKNVEISKEKIAESENKIKQTTEELHDVLIYMQTVSEEKVYLEFIMRSNSMAEFIERKGIIGQLINYQESEIGRLEQLILDNQELQTRLSNENVTLENSINEYQQKILELDDYLSSLASIGLDYNEQVKAQQALIKTYEDAGCKDNDSIDLCYYSKLIGASKLVRPLAQGTVSQAYGNKGHNGIDLAGNSAGTAMFAAAPGVVASVSYKNSCGGNIVTLHHMVNGVAYTTLYGHMKDVYVKTGDRVTATTQIGTVGGDKSTWYYDKCTTGSHLHYTVALGHYLGSGDSGYTSWSTFMKKASVTGDQSVIGIKNTRGFKWNSRY